MVEKDIVEKNFMTLEDVFADVYNGLLFKGVDIVKPEAYSMLTNF